MNLFLVTFASSFIFYCTVGQMLTDAENEERKRVCGKNMKFNSPYRQKVLNGKPASIKEAPWNVALEVLMGDPPGLCTGSIVSSRHVITARHCFAELSNGAYKWNVDGEPVPGCNETENDVVVEQNFDKMVKIFVGIDCGYRMNCQSRNFSEVKIRRLILPGICDDRTLDNDDLAIVELAENLHFTKRIRPICVAHDDSDIFQDGVKMRIFGFGLNPAKGNSSAGPLTYEEVHAKQCFSTIRKTFCTESYSGKQLGCVGDSGSGVVRLVDNRITLAGVLYQGVECKAETRDEQDFNVNLAFYSDDICRLSGICQGTTSVQVRELKERTKSKEEREWGEVPRKRSKMLSTSGILESRYRTFLILIFILLSQ